MQKSTVQRYRLLHVCKEKEKESNVVQSTHKQTKCEHLYTRIHPDKNYVPF